MTDADRDAPNSADTDPRQDWTLIWRLFDAAVELPEAQRQAWLEAQATEADAREQVLSLLQAHTAAELRAQSRPSQPDADPSTPLLAPGRIVGAWRIVRLIGSGGMGEVYEVQRDDGTYSQRAALKLLARIQDRDDTRRFERERQILAALDHPGIARLLDGGIHDQRPYAVLEYVEGRPITECGCKGDLRGCIELMLKVCEAVTAAHHRFVVHRDLKPGNVLVREDGQVKLLDFGIAKLMAADGGGADATQVVALSPDYCAPEQLENGVITTATDVYALGVMLFELLTGQRPWQGSGGAMTRAIDRLMHPDVTPPSRVVDRSRRHALQGDLDAIVLKALRPRASERYASVEALADDLRRHLEDRPVRARDGTRAYVAGRTLRRHRWWFAAGAAMFASLALGLAGTAWQAHQARIERDIARQEADRTDAVRQYLVYLFRTAGELRSGEPVTAKAVLDEAALRLQDEYATAPQRAAQMMQALGELYFLMNDYEGGIPLLEGLLQLPGTPAEPAILARARFDLGQMYYRSGRPDDAAPQLEQAQAFWNLDPPRYRAELASSLILKAQLQRASGDLEAAIATLEQARSEADAVFGPTHLDTGVVHNNLGLLYFHAGRLDEADRAFSRAWSVWEARHSTRGGDAVNTLNNWAAVASRRGALDQAETLYRQALKLRRELFAPSAALAALLSNYGKLMLQKGDPDAALPLLAEAVDLAREYAGPRSPHMIAAMLGLADAHTARGQTDTADGVLTQAEHLALEATGPTHPLAVMVGLSRARWDAASGRPEAAALRLDAAEQAFAAMGPAGQAYRSQVDKIRRELRL